MPNLRAVSSVEQMFFLVIAPPSARQAEIDSYSLPVAPELASALRDFAANRQNGTIEVSFVDGKMRSVVTTKHARVG